MEVVGRYCESVGHVMVVEHVSIVRVVGIWAVGRYWVLVEVETDYVGVGSDSVEVCSCEEVVDVMCEGWA